MTPETINEYAAKVYAQNVAVGWWDNPDRDIFQTLQLVNTEIAEATEGDRKDLMDDHLPHRKMVEVELADTLIRLFDLAGRYGWKFDSSVSPLRGLVDAKSLAPRHFWLTASVIEIGYGVTICGPESEVANKGYSICVSGALEIARFEGYDLQGAIDEKLEYNATRHDHKREVRAEFDGKRY